MILDFNRLQKNYKYQDKVFDMAILQDDCSLLPGFVDSTEEVSPINNLDVSFSTHFRMDTATNDEDEVTLIRHESVIFEIDPIATNKTQCLTTVVEELTSSVPLINSTEPTFVVIRSNILLPSNATKLVSTLFFEPFFHLVTVRSMILAELFQWAKRCTSSIFCAYPRGDSRNILVSCCMLLIMFDGLFACLPWD